MHKQLVSELQTIGQRKTDSKIWESVLYYFTSILLNKYNIKKDIPYMNDDIKYFSIIFAQSAAGKTFVVNRLKKIFNFNTSEYAEIMYNRLQIYLDNLAESGEQLDEDEIELRKRFLPKSATISLNGTGEGLFEVCKSWHMTSYGSFNLYSDEFGDIISSSSGLLDQLKSLYDGEWIAKVIKGDKETGRLTENLYGVNTNMLAVGSNKALDYNSSNILNKLLTSGLYRRTYMINIPSKEIQLNEEKSQEEYVREYIESVEEWLRDKFKSLYTFTKDFNSKLVFGIEDDAKEHIKQIQLDLIEKYNNDMLDELKEFDTGAVEIIIDLAYIIAILNKANNVTVEHLNYAFDFFNETRKTVKDIFGRTHNHIIMYDLLKRTKSPKSYIELMEINHNLPSSKNKQNDVIGLLKDYCYIKSERLHEIEGIVTKYLIEELPSIDIDKDKFKVSVVCEEDSSKYARAIMYKPIEIKWNTIKDLVTSNKASSFTVSHFLPSSKTEPYNCSHRKDDLFIEGQNLLAFDIDDGMTLDEAKELLKYYRYIIYTTKSHQKEKNGVICDRFRIIIPTNKEFYVAKAMYKQLYINVEELLGIQNDASTRNPTRLFFTNHEAKVYENDGDLLNIECCIPRTEKEEVYNKAVNNVIEHYKDNNELQRRLNGYIKWFLANTSKGNRNNNLFKAFKFYVDITSDIYGAKEFIELLNSNMIEPIEEKELRLIARDNS